MKFHAPSIAFLGRSKIFKNALGPVIASHNCCVYCGIKQSAELTKAAICQTNQAKKRATNMTQTPPETIYLADYTPPNYLIDTVHLTFRLAPDATRVISRIQFRPNPKAESDQFFLHGEGLTLISATIDGAAVTPQPVDGGLTCPVPNAPFVWETEVEIDPAANTALEGLYMSNGMYCTQCEAEGFRKITYYPDRPDVMAVFTVRIEGDAPVLLSNGNPGDTGKGWAEWHDPWPKPAYLFALVAGDLVAHPDAFTTSEGRQVALNIWVRPGDEDKCAFGMDALKRSMVWDEEVYGRAYDLDLFNIVAVDDFNMGAMENKGLNIFNSSCVLASADTSTDADFERIEAIIAHEYFHNWTGNRITCRDWFQLCLKEGLTVFRDQQFTGDMRGHAVKRIDDAIVLRARQFREDQGPLAHPVRPASFVEINNFYTVTVYEKGAELIGMLKRLVGDEAYDRALELYFARHDGDAATIEDWLAVFEETTGRDLSQFKGWYELAGTPQVRVSETWENGVYTLHFEQETQPTPGQSDKVPMVVPIVIGLLDETGVEVVESHVFEMTESVQSTSFNGLKNKPIPSILRDFSAPVSVHRDTTDAERTLLLAHDTDPFNRWESGRILVGQTLAKMATDGASPSIQMLDALLAVARDDTLDPAFRALVLSMPSQEDTSASIAASGRVPDSLAIHRAHETLRQAIAQHMQDILPRLYATMQIEGAYAPTAVDGGKRALGNTVMRLLSQLDGGTTAQAQFAAANNMTQQVTALNCLVEIDKGADALAAFEAQWSHDRLVMNKWFGVQVQMAQPQHAAQVAQRLTEHPQFDWKNPNRFRAVMGALAANSAGFHSEDGASYDLLADWLIRLDPINPQTTARMTAAFETWKRFDVDRQARIKSALNRIQSSANLSRDTGEMVGRILSA